MSISIGRAFDGVTVDVATASWSGSTLSLTGDLYLGSVTAANRKSTAAAVRDRLLALVSSLDEPAVPVVWTDDGTVDGWYRPQTATVDYSAASLNDGYAAWSCDLLAVEGTPQIEVLGYYGVIPNDVSLTNATLAAASGGTICGIPGPAVDVAGGGGNFAARYGSFTRTGASGDAMILSGTATSLPSASLSVFTVDPSDAYDGACELRGTYGGVADLLCLGRSMAPIGGTGLTISNGLVRCGFVSSGNLKVECYDAAAWRTVGAASWSVSGPLAPTGTSTFTLDCNANSRLQVIRNAPEQVTVRIFNIANLLTAGRFWLDVTVRRGSRLVEFHLYSDINIRTTVAPSSNVASTAITGGLRQTSNDANGNRSIVVGARGNGGDGTGSDFDWDTDTTTGAITQDVSISTQWWSSAPFAIGVELDGSSATGINAALQVAYEFFAGRSETVRVVMR